MAVETQALFIVVRISDNEIEQNRPFPSTLCLCFKGSHNCETILMRMTGLHENETACRTHEGRANRGLES